MENKAKDQRLGPDPLGHEARDRSQTAASGGGPGRDRMCSTLLLTLRVGSLFSYTALLTLSVC